MELPVTDDPSGEMTCRRRFSDSSSKHTMVEPGVSVSRIFPVHGARRRRSPWTHSRLHLLRTLHVFDVIPVILACLSLFSSSVCASAIVERHAGYPHASTITCSNFTRGNDVLREFYSPGWPAMYPNNTNCVRTISAPDGHLIQIDFRDWFQMEESPKCENDFLLVRDGRETYSRQLARVCGHQFPEMIRSSGSHLWLRFHSDENIQYRGFRAVYTFHKDEAITPAPECKFEVSGPEIIISTSNISSEFVQEAIESEVALDCSWRITVTAKREIQVSFTEFKLNKPNECELNFVEILHGPELNLVQKARFCSSKADSVKLPNGQDVTFRFFAAPSTLPSLLDEKTSVESVVTELRPRSNDESCEEDEYDCDDLYCINRDLVCNGNFNCDKQLDEKENCDDLKNAGGPELLTNANIIIMVIGAALLFGLCFSVCWNCIRKLREDIREKEEYMRQSQEEALDTLPPVTMPRVRSRVTLDDGGCYVPGMSVKTSAAAGQNGGARLVREETVDLDVETAERACQTPAERDSGGSGASTPPPPPPPARPPASPLPAYRHYPPPPAYGPAYSVGGSEQIEMRPRRSGGQPVHRRHRSEHLFDEEEEENSRSAGRSGNATPRSYRSEAVIEMRSRPGSLHSAKSAPDVVVKL